MKKEVEEPKQTLWDKKQGGCINHRDGNYQEYFKPDDVKQALKEFLNNLKPQGHNLDSDSCLSSENYKLAKEIFGEEMLK
jgi:hypothetical protein